MSIAPPLHLWKKIIQRSPEWYQARRKVITATDVASILELSPYETKYDLFQRKQREKKQTDVPMTNNPALLWGEKHEEYAKKLYDTLPLSVGKRVRHEVGLVHHKSYPFLAASPDGVLEKLEGEKKFWLLEIKCPYKRRFQEEEKTIPLYIWVQVQIQLEVCDLPMCHLLQCWYGESEKLLHRKLSTIQRNTEWFQKVALPEIRSFCEYLDRADRFPLFQVPYPNKKEWVSMKAMTGFILNDPILDFFDHFSHHPKLESLREESTLSNVKMKERDVLSRSLWKSLQMYLHEEKELAVEITPLEERNREAFSMRRYQQVVTTLNSKVAGLYRPVLMDKKEKRYGIADALVRSDRFSGWIEKRYENCRGLEHLKKDQYVVVCFHTKTRPWKKKDGCFQKWDKVLETRNVMLVRAINEMTQTTNTVYALVGAYHVHIVDPSTYPEVAIRAEKGARWLREIAEHGEEWINNLDQYQQPPSPVLYPNMSNRLDQSWRTAKQVLAERWGELSLLWYCGVAQRKRAHSHNIYSWKDATYTPQEVVDSMLIDAQTEASLRRRIMKRMIQLHRTEDKLYDAYRQGERDEPYDDDPEETQEFYVDFEMIPSSLLKKKDSQGMIYLIGVGWVCPETKSWMFRSFIAKDLTYTSEKKMITEFMEHLKNVCYNEKRAVLYHWSSAEPRWMKKALLYHNLYQYQEWLEEEVVEWRDLMEMFMDAEVVVRGVWGYSLKDLAKGLHKHGILPVVWAPGEKGWVPSGEGTLTTASKCYQKSKHMTVPVEHIAMFESLLTYNEMDCRVMYDLLDFLRKQIYRPRKIINDDPFLLYSPLAVWISPTQEMGMPVMSLEEDLKRKAEDSIADRVKKRSRKSDDPPKV